MKRTQWWQCWGSVLIAGVLMTSCAARSTEAPGTAVPTASLNSRIQTAAPVEACAAFLPPAPCSPYASVSGTAKGKDLPWLASGAVTVELTEVAGSLQLAVRTPCNPMSGPATVSGATLHAGNIALGAMGCVGDPWVQQNWVLQFLKRPIEMSSAGGVMVWKSGPDTLTFRATQKTVRLRGNGP